MGNCKMCGACCRQLVFEVPNLREQRIQLEYYKAHGCKIENNTIIVPMVCPHLTEDNLCDIHEKKPLLCKQFKGKSGKRKFWIPPGCTYG
ncbi:MAG: YkgJ family cysteine cluster protein [Candidatus Heimdallarchaeaceae archaeon]